MLLWPCEQFARAAEVHTTPAWQTEEGRAYEAARLDTGRAYIACLLTTLRDDDELTASDVRQNCATEGQQYAKYLPAEKVDEILQRTAFEVKSVEAAR